jgi:hypothetical protein
LRADEVQASLALTLNVEDEADRRRQPLGRLSQLTDRRLYLSLDRQTAVRTQWRLVSGPASDEVRRTQQEDSDDGRAAQLRLVCVAAGAAAEV